MAMISQKKNINPDELHFVNPFVHKLEWNDSVEKIKTALLTVFLLPFRTILIVILLLIAWLCAYIGLYGLSRQELKERPITGWRRQVRHIAAFTMRSLFFVGSFHYIDFKGVKAQPKEAPVIVAAPHTAFYDAMVAISCGPSAVVAKYETASLPFFGKLIDYTQPIYVCREDPNSRHNTIKEIIERANSKDDWPQILIFPEGTCTNRTSLIQFKPGAFYPGVPIQPVLVRYPNKIDTVTWTWEGPDAFSLLWRTLTQFHTFCEIEFLPVYVPNEEEKRDPKLFAKNVRNVMAAALGLPISDYTFDDCKLMTFVKNINMPYAENSADIEKLRKLCGLNKSNIETSLVATEKLDEGNRFINIQKFASLLEIDLESDSTIGLFNIFIKESNDKIDFREYLLSSLFLIKLYKPKLEFVKVLFQLYGNDGKIKREQFYDTLKYLIKIKQHEADVLFVKIDQKKTGEITYVQFSTFIISQPDFYTKLQKNNDPNNLRLD